MALMDQGKRNNFVASAVKVLADHGLDGLDIDWEYPDNKEQAKTYVEVLRELRTRLDEYGQRATPQQPHYLLTIAAPCAPQKYELLDMRGMDRSLDFWNLMAYDFSGSWDSQANHQANLYGSPLSVDAAVSYFLKHGVPAHKLVVGVPLYGRAFDRTNGPGTPHGGVPQGSSGEGTFHYRVRPL